MKVQVRESIECTTRGLVRTDVAARLVSVDGFSVIDNGLPINQVHALREIVDSIENCERIQTRSGAPYAARNLVALAPALRGFAESRAVRDWIEPILGSEAFIVRSILIDKTSSANWPVPWHQDVTIAVRERIDTPGYGPWSVKAGVVHVQPPATVLEKMLAIRVHLDDADEHNGALWVQSGSHRLGILNAEAITQHRQGVNPVCCSVKAGGVMLMRPLLLHASRRSERPARRRVLHFEFAAEPLPLPLCWESTRAA